MEDNSTALIKKEAVALVGKLEQIKTLQQWRDFTRELFNSKAWVKKDELMAYIAKDPALEARRLKTLETITKLWKEDRRQFEEEEAKKLRENGWTCVNCKKRNRGEDFFCLRCSCIRIT